MAKSYLSDYSPTPASNTDIDGVDSTGATGRVKDGDNYTRSVMSHLAKFYDDLGAVNTVGGTATAITVTAAEGWTAYGSSANQIDTGTILAIKAGWAAAGATTINVNSLGAKAVRRQGDSAIQANDWIANAILMLRYDAAYAGAAGAWVLLNAPALVPRVIRTQVFTSSGTYTPHANMLYCIVEAWGAGGAGGGVDGATSQFLAGGGGGSGGYSRKVCSAADIGASKSVSIGVGGTGAVGTGGGNGSSSSLGTLCIALGGVGGGQATGAGASGRAGAGAGTGTGDIAAPGTSGSHGMFNTVVTPYVPGGNGGATSLGGNGRGPDLAGSSAIAGNAAAANTGGGGSGAVSYDTNADAAGGSGGSGYVFITEFCSA